MGTDNRGAFGSNQPLERIPYEPPAPVVETEKSEVLASSAAHPVSENLKVSQEVEKPPFSPDEDEPVYLREELRPPRS